MYIYINQSKVKIKKLNIAYFVYEYKCFNKCMVNKSLVLQYNIMPINVHQPNIKIRLKFNCEYEILIIIITH